MQGLLQCFFCSNVTFYVGASSEQTASYVRCSDVLNSFRTRNIHWSNSNVEVLDWSIVGAIVGVKGCES